MILPIVLYPSPELLSKAKPVTKFDKGLRELVSSMFETMYKSDGIGLAAPQVGVGQRVAVMDLQQGKGVLSAIVLVNPEILERSKEEEEGEEGCLSLPGQIFWVKRAKWVRVRYQDEYSQWSETMMRDRRAIVAQHEIDHLDGILANAKGEQKLF